MKTLSISNNQVTFNNCLRKDAIKALENQYAVGTIEILNRVQIENWSFETKESGARSQELVVSGSKY